MTEIADPRRIDSLPDWVRLLLGLAAVFGLFQWSAAALASNRGEAGILVGLIVVAATVAVERLLFGRTRGTGLSLGLGVPDSRGLLVVGVVAVLLFFVVLVYVRVHDARLGFFPTWIWLLPGLFAQGGIAEEVLFRGYLFGHLRRGRPFLRAAALSTVPFVAVHLFLFWTMPWPIAAAAIMLSVALSMPLAHLFEVGGGTIWAPALLHFIVQGTVKVLVISEDGDSTFPLWWMAASAVVPMVCFLVPRRVEPSRDARHV